MAVINNSLILIGSVFILIAAIGVIRLPGVYQKMHAATKVGTLGCGCILLGVSMALKNIHGSTEALLLIFFIACPFKIG